VLTVDFDRLPVAPGALVLDLGCGSGRHACEAMRRGARVVALDRDREVLKETASWFAALAQERTLPDAAGFALCADAHWLPFPDAVFDCVITSEVLEHVADDARVMQEAARVLKPDGVLAASVPRWFPERLCWAVSTEYHSNAGGHVRVYRGAQLVDRLELAGLHVEGTHHAHALHSPYWWLKCLLGVRGEHWVTRAYHRLLMWQIEREPLWLDRLEARLNPILGKSLVVYARKPVASAEEPSEKSHAA
jgi:SAM-dependent methyltransferase